MVKLVWIFLITVFLLTYGIKERLFIYRNIFILPIFLFFIWTLITLNRCTNIFAGLYNILVLLLFVTLYISLENLVVRDTILIDIFIKYVVFISIVVSIYGLVQVFGIDFIKWQGVRSALSTLGRRNFAGEYLVMVIPYVYYLLYKEKKWYLYIILLLLISHLVFTFTRASYIAFFISSIVFFILAGKEISLKWRVVFLICILFFAGECFPGIATFEKGTLKSRFLIWNITLKMIKKNPLMGVGPGNFVVMYPYYAIGEEEALKGTSLLVDRAHNDYLEICAELGIPGFILFLYFLYCFFKICSVLYKEGGKERRLLTAGIVSSVVAICINALASFPFGNPTTLLLFWANVSFAGGMYRKDIGNGNITVKKEIPYILLKIYLLIFIAGGFVLSVMGIRASRYIYIARNTYGMVSLKSAEKAVKNNPFSFECPFISAMIATRQGEYEKAYRFILMAKRLYPHSVNVYNNLGLICFQLGRFNEAEESYLYALKLNPSAPRIYSNLGVLYMNTDRYDEAITCFKKSIFLKPDFDLAYFNLGLTYYLKNDYKNAEIYFKKTLDINPEFNDARELLSKLGK
ncbi:MAG: tetratricopeptide repeat protein [bacterium]|nr:tetratricopeptide repeat protein [bacterium]